MMTAQALQNKAKQNKIKKQITKAILISIFTEHGEKK